MGSRIYVGNLPFSATEAELNEMFSESGTVASVRLITDRESGKSKGFGFVEMSSQDEAEAAIRTLNGKQLEGRCLTVNEAKPQEKRENDFGGKSRFGARNRSF